jgi:glycolate oxidase
MAVVRIAAERHIPVVPRGAATNCAAAVMGEPDRVMVDLSAMNQVLDINATARTANVA